MTRATQSFQLLRCLCILLLFLLQSTSTESIRTGKADLIIHHLNPSLDGTPPQVGDILNLAFKIDAQNENITGVVIFLTIGSDYFDIIPAQETPFSVKPFRSGDWLDGSIAENSTLGDKIDDAMANKRPGFQLIYNEDRPRRFDSSNHGVSGKGILAELSVRLIKPLDNPLQAITVEHTSPTGGETGYFIANFPGTTYSLNVKFLTRLTGDFNNDNTCDFQDFLMFIQNYGQSPNDRTCSARYDVDGNQEIGFGDFLIFTQLFGK